MLAILRPFYRWCVGGFLVGAVLAVGLVGLAGTGWVDGLVLAPGLGFVGAGFGLVVGLFWRAGREVGWGVLGRRALGGAGVGLASALGLKLLGTSLAGSLAADLVFGPVMLGLTAAYFAAVEFWIRRHHETSAPGSRGAG